MNEQVQRFNHVAGTTLALFGRAVVGSGAWATQAAISSITATVKPTAEDATFSDSLTKATVLFDIFQTSDPAWTADTNDARTQRGYNFAWRVPASAFPEPGWYTIEVVFTDTSGYVTKLLFEGAVRGSLT